MALLAVSVFLRVDYLLKLIVMICTSVTHIVLVSYVNRELFAEYYVNYNDGYVSINILHIMHLFVIKILLMSLSFVMYIYYTLGLCFGILSLMNSFCFTHFSYLNIPFEAKTTFFLLFVISILHIFDRHTESTTRADFLWKSKLQVSSAREMRYSFTFTPEFLSRTFLLVLAYARSFYRVRRTSAEIREYFGVFGVFHFLLVVCRWSRRRLKRCEESIRFSWRTSYLHMLLTGFFRTWLLMWVTIIIYRAYKRPYNCSIN